MINDTYMHIDSKVMYVEESIPGPPENTKEYEELINMYNSQITRFCICNEICSSQCCCVLKSGGQNYVSNEDDQNLQFRLNYEQKNFKILSIIECNKLCKCTEKCGNRVVQYGPKSGLVVNTCKPETKGHGLYTKMFVSSGTYICEYAGELITRTQALMRQSKNKAEGRMNYIYALNEHTKGEVIQTFIDPTYFGNIGRYINHSCVPNCIIIPVRINSPIPKLAIFSCKDILPDYELSIDYGSSSTGREKWVQKPRDSRESADQDRKICLCNSSKCRGWMPFNNY